MPTCQQQFVLTTSLVQKANRTTQRPRQEPVGLRLEAMIGIEASGVFTESTIRDQVETRVGGMKTAG